MRGELNCAAFNHNGTIAALAASLLLLLAASPLASCCHTQLVAGIAPHAPPLHARPAVSLAASVPGGASRGAAGSFFLAAGLPPPCA